MSHANNKVEWCLRKAEKELQNGKKHRGLIQAKPSKEKAYAHIAKAEHYILASDWLHKGNFSDICASTLFYSMYHCLLAIAAKHGFESRNQECTFALINWLIESKKISFDREMLDKIALMDTNESIEYTCLELREMYQYGTSLSLKENLYDELSRQAKAALMKAKEEMEG
ncbi:MAG: hypothetical protein PHO02_02865 [Candidatus Nanoarchaeia archaeon]|nr:hypothetical protein [Candidatus Nanoarchaeia archaeon]